MQTWFRALGLALCVPLSWAQLDQTAVEPTSFNVTEALLLQGIDLSLLEEANLNLTARGESTHPTCPLMVRRLFSPLHETPVRLTFVLVQNTRFDF